MIKVLASIALRLALVAALTFAAWHWAGPIPALFAACLSGMVLAQPLLDLASELRHGLRAAAWREVQGRYYAFHGRPVLVSEDADHRRWVRVADVRAIVGFTATDGALALTYPAGFRRLGRAQEAHLSDDALVVHLSREPSAAALKFRHWAEREIAFPARRVREKLGIRLPSPERPEH